jgi:hypothetical protein
VAGRGPLLHVCSACARLGSFIAHMPWQLLHVCLMVLRVVQVLKHPKYLVSVVVHTAAQTELRCDLIQVQCESPVYSQPADRVVGLALLGIINAPAPRCITWIPS